MIIVLDLDKTLLTKDSFPAWALFMLKQAAFSNPLLFLHLLFLIVSRAIRIINHLAFKKKIMILLDTSDWNEIFAQEIAKHVNAKVLEHATRPTNARYVLSTAAPIQYIRHLAPLLPIKFESVFASSIENGKLIDNSGSTKVEAFTKKYKDMKCDVFFTDHYNDIPMMKMSTKTILVNPSKKTSNIVKENLITAETL